MARQVGHDDHDRDNDTYVVSEGLSVVDSISSSKVEDEGEAPAVFLCGKCRLPFGDSLSWAGSDDEQNQILLKRANDNIVIGKETFVCGKTDEVKCLAVNLTCRGCSFKLGYMYTSTPKSLDYKRSIFCLMVENVESYVLDSHDQQVAAVGREERPVTLDYVDNVEQQITKIKSLAVTIGKRLLEIEVDLQRMSGAT